MIKLLKSHWNLAASLLGHFDTSRFGHFDIV